jgi:hypothetical protein
MSEGNPPGESARIEQLLEDLEAIAPGPVWQRVSELVQRLVQLYGAGLERCLGHLRAAGALDQALADRLAGDDLLASLLLLHGLHPWPLERRVHEALERARPRLGPQLGAFELVAVEGEVARVRLERRPAAELAADRLLHRALADAAPEIARVELEGFVVAAAPARREALVQIGLPRDRTPEGVSR